MFGQNEYRVEPLQEHERTLRANVLICRFHSVTLDTLDANVTTSTLNFSIHIIVLYTISLFLSAVGNEQEADINSNHMQKCIHQNG